MLVAIPKMKRITKAAWGRVIEKACDVANATRTDNDPMFEVYREQMRDILDDLEAEFGLHSEILDTRADYTDDPQERRRLCMRALELAREKMDQDEIETILESLRKLDRNTQADAADPRPE